MKDPYYEAALDPSDFPYKKNSDVDSWAYPIYEESEAPVLVFVKNKLKLFVMHFTLVPHTRKRFSQRFTSAFARRESIFEKKLWKHSLENKRCLVPMTAFFERCLASYQEAEWQFSLERKLKSKISGPKPLIF